MLSPWVIVSKHGPSPVFADSKSVENRLLGMLDVVFFEVFDGALDFGLSRRRPVLSEPTAFVRRC